MAKLTECTPRAKHIDDKGGLRPSFFVSSFQRSSPSPPPLNVSDIRRPRDADVKEVESETFLEEPTHGHSYQTSSLDTTRRLDYCEPIDYGIAEGQSINECDYKCYMDINHPRSALITEANFN